MKVTLDGIKAKIKGETYLVLPDGRTTLCILDLENGYTIKGLSACVDPAEFDLNIGRKYAFDDAFKQIWALEGYLLAEKMYLDKVDKELFDSAFPTNGDGIVKFNKPTTSHRAVKKVIRKGARK
ncbi:sf6 [Caudoviricetes sp.]|nr:sf6 [Caudoviricetes sp.]